MVELGCSPHYQETAGWPGPVHTKTYGIKCSCCVPMPLLCALLMPS